LTLELILRSYNMIAPDIIDCTVLSLDALWWLKR
jgi:hypothetical protein